MVLREAVMSAATRPEVRAAVLRVYADLQREVDARKPVCDASGRCCRFEEFGHRLYVTTGELATFVHSLPLPGTSGGGASHGGAMSVGPSLFDDRSADQTICDSSRTSALSLAVSSAHREEGASGGGCPFQIGGLCSVHAIRPFGCRIFFCDPTSEDWQHQQYERFHAELKRVHDDFGIPYRYLEWRAALRELDLPLAVSPARAGRRLSLPQIRF